MILTIRNEWANGSTHEMKSNYTASQGRYVLASMRTAVQFPTTDIENGFEYVTPRQYCGNAGKCKTTVTLTRGWC
jgi:hypothetical protein